jgi:transposase
MLLLPPSVRIFMACRPADMRWSFDRLAALTREVIEQDPTGGHVFVFRNKRGDKLKLLWWDVGGYSIWYRRLEEGTFEWPPTRGERAELSAATLAMMLEGIELSGARRRKRFGPSLP